MITAPERWPRDTILIGIFLSAKSITSGASMKAAWRPPDISDSFTSGQPLYLLYSNANCGLPLLSARFATALAAQATGSVRLQVTAKPPTTRGSAAAAGTGQVMAGSAAAASAPPSSCRRWTRRSIPIIEECIEGPSPMILPWASLVNDPDGSFAALERADGLYIAVDPVAQ